MKKVLVYVSTCNDCPYLSHDINGPDYCGKYGYNISTDKIPKWCSLPDATPEELSKAVTDGMVQTNTAIDTIKKDMGYAPLPRNG